MQGDAIAGSGKHLTRADGHDLVEYMQTCKQEYRQTLIQRDVYINLRRRALN